MDALRKLLDSVSSLGRFRDRQIETYQDMSANQLAAAMSNGMAAASLAGRYDVLSGL